MNKLLFPLTVLGVLALAFTGSARTIEDIRKAGEIRLGNSADYEPFYFKQNGKLTGFEVELGNALAARLGVKPNWRQVDFDSLLVTVDQGRLDAAIASHTITAVRARIVDFANPHYCTGTVIVSRAGGPNDPTQLAGKSVSATQSSTFATFARSISGAKVVTFKQEQDALDALRQGKVDAYITDRLAAVAYAKKYPTPKLQISALLTTERIAIAVKKGNTNLLNAINESLAALYTDGTYAKLSQKYFGADIRCQ
jgi:polar amino acid transport system substrate-binding protein